MIDLGMRRKAPLRRRRRLVVCGALVVLAVTTCTSPSPGPTRGALLRVDSKTGQRLWHASLPMASVSTPVVSGGLLIVAGANDCNAHRVVVAALKAKTGQLVWQRSVANDLPCRFTSLISVAGGVVVVGGPTEAFLPSTQPFSCHHKAPTQPAVALDVKTGKPRWRSPVTTSVVLAATSKYVIMNGPTSACIVGLDAGSGKQRWAVDAKGPSFSASASSDTAYVTRFIQTRPQSPPKQQLDAVTPGTGRSRWSVQLPFSENGLSTAVGNAIVIAETVDTFPTNQPHPEPISAVTLTGLDPTSGRQLWREHRQGTGYERLSVVATGNALLITHMFPESFRLELRDARSGARRWQLPIRQGFEVGSLTDGNLVVALSDKGAAGMSAANGQQRWAVHGTFESAAIVGTSTYLVTTRTPKNQPPLGD